MPTQNIQPYDFVINDRKVLSMDKNAKNCLHMLNLGGI